jgi:hypothetical protein
MIEMVLKREAKARKGDDQLLKIALEILKSTCLIFMSGQLALPGEA